MTLPVYRPFPFREKIDPEILDGFRRAGAVFEKKLHRKTVGIITLLTMKVDRALLDRAPALKVVSNVAVGYDNVDVTECARRGIVVTNTPGVLTDATADLAWVLLTGAARRVVEGDRYVRAGKFKAWDFYLMRGMDFAGRTLGIVGGGRIGQAVARRALGFGMRILYTAREPKPDFERTTGARRVDLPALLRASDFVSLHVPMSPETRHLIGAKELALMKPTAVLVNTARGPVVDEGALAKALRARRIFAAGLDVYEREPAVHRGLLALDNVVLLPHVGSATEGARLGMVETAHRNCLAVLRGEPPPNPVR
ncbi:MAG TPA: D-glycerate dehydrogenase [Planctomycetota bacterium]|nr:D-glycerate dehydrogenase [Planctomycetota bacterium]